MKESELRALSGAEVMSWNVDQVPFAVSEQSGPLVVKLGGEVVRGGMYRWWCHPRIHGRSLVICDPRRHMRVLGEYGLGEWDEVSHDTRLAGMY